MPARKMRVELFDSDGNRYTIAFEGQITRDKAVRLLDLMELLGGVSNETNRTASDASAMANEYSKYEKVRMIIQRNFPLVWFSSKEAQMVYEQEFKEPITPSTISTYLSRLADRGALLKTGGLNNMKYRIARKLTQPQIKQ
jgi:hypothetical protein